MLGLTSGDINTMFRGGWNAIWQIALLFAVVSAFYPKVAFIKRDIEIKGNNDIVKTLNEFFADRSYEIYKQEDNKIIYRAAKIGHRITRMMEDAITIEILDDHYTMEGPRKDIMRFASALEYMDSGLV